MVLDFSPMQFHAYKLAQAFNFLTPKEVFTLMTLAWTLPENPRIVNVGSGSGTSGLAFREARPDATIYTVDISPSGPLGGLENERNAFEGKGLNPTIQILGDSHEVGNYWQHGMVDLIFIDADHSYEGCKGDLMAWRQWLKPGGIMAFHDYRRDEFWPDVQRVLNDPDNMVGFDKFGVVDTLYITILR
jgi:predicted O-methyltransferase YrrM